LAELSHLLLEGLQEALCLGLHRLSLLLENAFPLFAQLPTGLQHDVGGNLAHLRFHLALHETYCVGIKRDDGRRLASERCEQRDGKADNADCQDCCDDFHDEFSDYPIGVTTIVANSATRESQDIENPYRNKRAAPRMER
jgi:hypothetical protein